MVWVVGGGHPQQDAFGRDYQRIDASHLRPNGVGFQMPPDIQGKLVAVWKFPAHLNSLNGFHPIYNIPLPVCTSPFMADTWWQRPLTKNEPNVEMPLEVVMLEKQRIYFLDGSSIHYLVNHANDSNMAMLSSHHFISDFWKITPEETRFVNNVCQTLWLKAGILAVPVWKEHHALVFYTTRDGILITAKRWGQILSNDRDDVILTALGGTPGVKLWKKNYIDFFKIKT